MGWRAGRELGVKMDDDRANRLEVGPFIDGLPVASASDRAVDAIDPSTGKVVFKVPIGCQEDVDRAVASCRRVFENGDWSVAPPAFRRKALHRLADLIEVEASALDALDAVEMGKPISVTRSNAMAAAGLVRFCAEAVDKLGGDVYPSDDCSLIVQRRVPRGVVAAIAPWNFPTSNAVLKTVPALAGGNCVVLKPSEMSTRSAFAWRTALPTASCTIR